MNDVSFSGCLPKLSHGSREHSLNGSRQQYSSSGSSNVSSREASLNTLCMDRSTSDTWSFYNHICGGSGAANTQYPTTVRNPNKAVCTINAKTSEVSQSFSSISRILREGTCGLWGVTKALAVFPQQLELRVSGKVAGTLNIKKLPTNT